MFITKDQTSTKENAHLFTIVRHQFAYYGYCWYTKINTVIKHTIPLQRDENQPCLIRPKTSAQAAKISESFFTLCRRASISD